jgi:hypothetical protein
LGSALIRLRLLLGSTLRGWAGLRFITVTHLSPALWNLLIHPCRLAGAALSICWFLRARRGFRLRSFRSGALVIGGLRMRDTLLLPGLHRSMLRPNSLFGESTATSLAWLADLIIRIVRRLSLVRPILVRLVCCV